MVDGTPKVQTFEAVTTTFYDGGSSVKRKTFVGMSQEKAGHSAFPPLQSPEALIALFSAPAIGEGVEVLLPRTQEI